MSASLAGPRAKLDRARDHLSTLALEVEAFMATEPYAIEDERDPIDGDHVFRLHVREPVPLRIGTLVGDFATNTRAALDHLVWQLVLLAGNTPNSDTRFPIYKSPPQDLDAPKAPLARLTEKHRIAIAGFQPYAAGDNAEHMVLSWLVNTDKHRVVHPTFGFFPTPDEVYFTFHTRSGLQVPAIYEYIKIAKGRRGVDGAELARVKLRDPDLSVRMTGRFPIDVAFGDRWMRADALDQIHGAVRTFIESFAPEFP